MEGWTIDINCDVGEGIRNEEALFPFISSCNIACGGHAGNLKSMTAIVRLAKHRDIKIGAHPSYPDRENFGREVMELSDSELKQSIVDQLILFNGVLQEEAAQLHHIKAHGALYNQLVKDSVLTQVYLDAISEYKDQAFLYVPFKSVIAEMAEANGFRLMYEAFGDRNYNDDLSLISRKLKTALIQEPEKVLRHILPIVKQQKVTTLKREEIRIKADTICIHGDTPSALEILMYLSTELPAYQVKLQK